MGVGVGSYNSWKKKQMALLEARLLPPPPPKSNVVVDPFAFMAPAIPCGLKCLTLIRERLDEHSQEKPTTIPGIDAFLLEAPLHSLIHLHLSSVGMEALHQAIL